MWSQKTPHSCFVIFNSIYNISYIDNGKKEKLFK